MRGAGTGFGTRSAHLKDFADTAAPVLKQLDACYHDAIVLFAHLAGSIGRQVWNLLSTTGACTGVYLTGRDDSPWYPSMRLFRQPQPGDWDSVFEKVAVELEKAVSLKAGGVGR